MKFKRNVQKERDVCQSCCSANIDLMPFCRCRFRCRRRRRCLSSLKMSGRSGRTQGRNTGFRPCLRTLDSLSIGRRPRKGSTFTLVVEK